MFKSIQYKLYIYTALLVIAAAIQGEKIIN
jgi:hypothetical protein